MKAAGPNSSRPQVRLARFMYRYFAADRDRVRTGSTARHPAGPLYERAELPGRKSIRHIPDAFPVYAEDGGGSRSHRHRKERGGENHQKARQGGQSGVAETLLLCGSKITGPSERGYQSDIRMPPAQKTTASGGDCYGFPSSVLTVSCQERK